MRVLLVLLMLMSGVALGVQMVLNTRVREATGSPILSALVSIAVSATLLGVLMTLGLFGGVGDAPAGFKLIPPWAYFGGVCGALYLVAMVVALPRIGAAATVCATVLGQQVISLMFDTFGWLGVPRTPLTPSRLIGAAMLFVGVVLLQRR